MVNSKKRWVSRSAKIKKSTPRNFRYDLRNIEKEEDDIVKEFEKMELFLKNIKYTNMVQEIKNTDQKGLVEKSVIKSVPEKKIRKTFKGCKVQQKTVVMEKESQDGLKDEYFEVKKIYRECPKNK
jgi:hypothetical protein